MVRLVKGAYWDHELIQAQPARLDGAGLEHKADCDRNFERLTRRLLDARPAVRVAIASHNLRSVAHAIAYNRLSGGADVDLEIQVLRGLGDELQDALARSGCGCVPTARSATSSPAWPTWCGGCSRTPPTTRSCRRRPRAWRSSSCSPRRSALSGGRCACTRNVHRSSPIVLASLVAGLPHFATSRCSSCAAPPSAARCRRARRARRARCRCACR